MAWQPWITYFVPSGTDALTRVSRNQWVSAHGSKAEADAYAANGGNNAVVQLAYGSGTLLASAQAVATVPILLGPGQAAWYDVANNRIIDQPIAPPSRLQLFRRLHEALNSLGTQLITVGASEPPDTVALTRAYSAWAHRGVFVVAQRLLAGTYSDAQVLAWVGATGLGTTDISSTPANTIVARYYTALERLRGSDGIIPDRYMPHHPIVWASPVNASRVALAGIITLSGSGAGNLDLGSTNIPPETDFATGGWITAAFS